MKKKKVQYYDSCEKCGYKAETRDDLIKHHEDEHNLFGKYTMGVETE